MKTRLICAVCLLLCLLTALPLASCAVNKPSGAVGSTTDGSGSDPRRAEELAVKTSALKILNGYNDAKDPASIFDFFKRSFELTDYDWKNGYYADDTVLYHLYVTDDHTIMLRSEFGNMYRVPYVDGLLTVIDGDLGPESLITLEKYPSDILAYLDIPVPSASAEKDGLELPELIAEKLTVSEDLKICSLPADFLTAYAEYMAKSVDETIGQPDGSSYAIEKISGVYDVETDSVTISFTAKLGEGSIEQETSITGDIGNGGNIVSKVKAAVVKNKTKIPIETEIIYSDMKFRGSDPVAAKITVTVKSVTDYIVQGFTYKLEVTDERVFYANVEDVDKPEFSYSSSTKTLIGGVESALSTENVRITCGGSGDCILDYDSQSGGKPVRKYTARLIFDPKDVPEIPQKVLDHIKEQSLPET